MHPATDLGPSVCRALGADHEWLCGALDRAILRLEDVAPLLDDATLAIIVQGLRRHLRVDHEILLPALADLDVTPLPSREVGRTHADLEAQLDQVDRLACTPSPRLRLALVRLRELLAHHAAIGDRLLYPLCDRLLDRDTRALAVRELDRKVVGARLPPVA